MKVIKTYNSSEEKFSGYLKFFWPEVEDWEIDIAKVWDSLIWLSKFYKSYCKERGIQEYQIKLKWLKKNCTEVDIVIQQIIPVVKELGTYALVLKWMEKVWVTEFWKQFFWTLGNVFALKLLSLWKDLIEKKRYINKQEEYIELENIKWEKKIFKLNDYLDYQKYNQFSWRIVQLEKWKEEKLKIWYYDENKNIDVVEVNYTEKKSFESNNDTDFYERLNEWFNEEKAVEVKIIWKFIDFFSLATKYRFSFQARKEIEKIWKQKILCIVEDNMVWEILDILKRDYWTKHNICLFWKANFSMDWKIDKIKVIWFSEDENYNPNQIQIS